MNVFMDVIYDELSDSDKENFFLWGGKKISNRFIFE